MGASFRSWWQLIKQHSVFTAKMILDRVRKTAWWQRIKQHHVATVLISLAALLVVLVILGYIFNWGWTGLGPYISPTKDSNFQRGKTLWDWLQLLIIPLALAIIAILFNRAERKNEQKIASDNQQEAALQGYIKEMSELMLERDLRKSDVDAEVRTIARVRTLTVLRRLDAERKGSVLQFLYEAGLINGDKDKVVIHLQVADLNGAKLTRIFLNGVNLSRVNLNEAVLYRAILTNAILELADLRGANIREADLIRYDLSNADLTEADLSGAILIGANLRGAIGTTPEQLAKAKSLEGATLPDGTKHD